LTTRGEDSSSIRMKYTL